MNFLRVKNWDQFQQYKDRDPKWIKVHRDLLYDYEMDQLDEIAQLHLVKIWLLAAKLDNKIPNDAEWIARQIGAKSKVDIKQLCTFGFLIVYESVQDCTETYLEVEAEAYKEEAEAEKPRKRGTRLQKKWQPSDELKAWAITKRPGLDLQQTIDSFTDYWISKTGQSATKLDWDATFRNWIRNDHSQRRTSKTTVQARDDRNRNAILTAEQYVRDQRNGIL